MRAGKISSYLNSGLVPTPDNANFIFLYKLAGSDSLYGKKSDGTTFAIGGSGSSSWGSITGVLTDQTDLSDALNLKADLVGGVVPASQLPSYVDDVLEGTYVSPTVFNDTFGNPYTPELSKIYIDTTSNHSYRWTGSVYFDISTGNIGNGTQDYLPQILIDAAGKIISFKNSNIYDNGELFQANLQAAGYIGASRIGQLLTMSNNERSAFVDIGGESSTFGRSVRINSPFNLVTGSAFTFYGSGLGITPGETAYFDASQKLISRPILIPIDLATAQYWEYAGVVGLIVPGEKYLITDAGDLGVVVTGTPNKHQFESSALAGFLDADYQNVGDYDLIESITGFAKGNFKGILNSTNTWDAASGDVGIWNNSIYQVIDGSAAQNQTPDSAPLAFYLFSRSNFLTERIGYIQKWENVEYNVTENKFNWRFDSRNNQVPFASLATFQFGNDKVVNNILFNSENVVNIYNNSGNFKGNLISQNASVFSANNEGDITNCVFQGKEVQLNIRSGFTHNKCKYAISSDLIFPGSESFDSKIVTDEYSTFTGKVTIDDTQTLIDLSLIKYAGNILVSNSGPGIPNVRTINNGIINKIRISLHKDSLNFELILEDSTGNVYINTRDKNTESGVELNKGGGGKGIADFDIRENSYYLTNAVEY